MFSNIIQNIILSNTLTTLPRSILNSDQILLPSYIPNSYPSFLSFSIPSLLASKLPSIIPSKILSLVQRVIAIDISREIPIDGPSLFPRIAPSLIPNNIKSAFQNLVKRLNPVYYQVQIQVVIQAYYPSLFLVFWQVSYQV